MKIFKKAVVLFLMLTMVCGLCFAAPKKKDTLDAAIREASDYLNSNIAKGSKIVILNIQSESGALSEYIIDELISNAVNDRVFLVVDRQQLDAIRAEQNFQFSGEVDDKQALEIGKFFGAQTIVSGSMGMIGKEYRLRVRALEVQTALVQGQFNKNITKSTLIPTLLASKPSGATTATTASARTTTTANTSSRGITIVNNTGVNMTLGYVVIPGTLIKDGQQLISLRESLNKDQTKTYDILPEHFNQVRDIILASSANVLYTKRNVTITQGLVLTFTPADDDKLQAQLAPPSTPATGVTGAYKIGDTGPAGGIIFYDKGNNSDGWRYLEAGPATTEFQAIWTVKNTKVEMVRPEIGSGKRNTQLIYETFNQTPGEWDTAAQKCFEFKFRGFNDWFLPSKDELDQMYGQLKRKNLGNFKNECYWSSTAPGYPHWGQDFSDGREVQLSHNGRYYVRPIRQVAGPAN